VGVELVAPVVGAVEAFAWFLVPLIDVGRGDGPAVRRVGTVEADDVYLAFWNGDKHRFFSKILGNRSNPEAENLLFGFGITRDYSGFKSLVIRVVLKSGSGGWLSPHPALSQKGGTGGRLQEGGVVSIFCRQKRKAPIR